MITTTSIAPVLDSTILDFAIIGAGISGLTLAKHLYEQGYSVAVFEKARGTGGRLSSKRVTINPVTINPVTTEQQTYMAFDLGCVSISAKTEEFSQQLKQWQEEGAVNPWWLENSMLGNGKVHYVGTPRNSALTRYLSLGIDCHFSTRIQKLEQVNEQGENIWLLLSTVENELDGVDKHTVIAKAKNVILATPPAQAYDLLPNSSNLKTPLQSVIVDPQWVMGIAVKDIPQELSELSIIDHNILYSISRETLKPGRASSDHSVLQVQATADWTRRHLDLNQEQISQLLIEALTEYTTEKFAHKLNVKHSYSHRWLYSQVVKKIESSDGYLFDQTGLGLVGDYFEQPIMEEKNIKENHIEASTNTNTSSNTDSDIKGVESAWLSGKRLATFLVKGANKKSANKKDTNKDDSDA